ncbi:MAG: addiction module toxin RelE [Candidatus Kapabacteria bacterium]|nr:addiction module toxin RelE [Candidatus Kapabacteria bacterium]
MQFVFSRQFSSRLAHYFTRESLTELLETLARNPTQGRVVRGLKGVRKLRFADRMNQSGTRGGLRVIYKYVPRSTMIILYLAYRKSDQDDLLPRQRREILNMAEFLSLLGDSSNSSN